MIIQNNLQRYFILNNLSYISHKPIFEMLLKHHFFLTRKSEGSKNMSNVQMLYNIIFNSINKFDCICRSILYTLKLYDKEN